MPWMPPWTDWAHLFAAEPPHPDAINRDIHERHPLASFCWS